MMYKRLFRACILTIDYAGIIAGVIKQKKTDFEQSEIYILRL